MVFPTPPFPPTKIHFRDFCSMMFFRVGSSASMSGASSNSSSSEAAILSVYESRAVPSPAPIPGGTSHGPCCQIGTDWSGNLSQSGITGCGQYQFLSPGLTDRTKSYPGAERRCIRSDPPVKPPSCLSSHGQCYQIGLQIWLNLATLVRDRTKVYSTGGGGEKVVVKKK